MNIPWNDQIRNVPLTNGEVVVLLKLLKREREDEGQGRHTPAAAPDGPLRDRLIGKLYSFVGDA